MKTDKTLRTTLRRAAIGAASSLLLLAMVLSFQSLYAQDTTVPGSAAAPSGAAPAPAERTREGYSIHETADLGGHIANIYGSGAMYNTLVNIHSGPRLLGETFDLRA